MQELDKVFESVARYFAMLSEPTRLKILHSICREEKSVLQIVAETGSTQSNISRQLGAMYRAGALARRKAGNVVYYRVADEALVDLCRTVRIRIASQPDEVSDIRGELLDLVEDMRRPA